MLMPAQSRAMAHLGGSMPNTVRYFPIIFFELFLLFTVVVFAFGPWDWPVTNPIELYSFLLINQLALFFGYVRAVRGRLPSPFRLPITPKELVWLATLTTLVLIFPLAITNMGGDVDFTRALTNPGQAYRDTRYAVSVAPYSIVAYIGIVFSPLIWPLMPLTVVFWRKLSLPLRVLAVLGITGWASTFFLIGQNTGMVDILLLIPWLLILQSKNPADLLQPKRVIHLLLLCSLFLAAFLPYFGVNIIGRGSTGTVGSEHIRGAASIDPVPLQIPGFDSPLANAYTSGTTALASYVGQGYYGLSLALQEPFVWTYGVGHSRFLVWLAEKAMGEQHDEMLDRTYPYRVESDYGWDGYSKWISLYPWLAGDVTFFGVPVVVFLLGRLLGLTWLDAIGGNPVAVVLFSLTAVTVCYISANPNVFQAANTVCVFYFYLLWWLQSRVSRGRRLRLRPVSHGLNCKR
jgi:hypothetical protein